MEYDHAYNLLFSHPQPDLPASKIHMAQNHRLGLQIEIMALWFDLHRLDDGLAESFPVAGMGSQHLAQVY